ncbi:hypothetical protein ACFU6S_24530 [Streptomyces sp. NPDC057456]|uniref:hypothetical protein n=1 Tax=Streptomyces sp. NPDC057456 TaxID=3346139 RepID=UPI0036AC2DE5
MTTRLSAGLFPTISLIPSKGIAEYRRRLPRLVPDSPNNVTTPTDVPAASSSSTITGSWA